MIVTFDQASPELRDVVSQQFDYAKLQGCSCPLDSVTEVDVTGKRITINMHHLKGCALEDRGAELAGPVRIGRVFR